MSNKKKYRRLRHLIHENDIYFGNYTTTEVNLTEHLDKRIRVYSDENFTHNKRYKKTYNEYVEIKKLVLELKISVTEYMIIAQEELKNRNNMHYNLRLNNLKETRDNKGTYIGSGGSNRYKVRYPKKNRSRKVWAKFYEMFPYRAKIDGWNGKKSKRT